MISIGSVFKGPELRETVFSTALRKASKVLSEKRGPLLLGEQPLVNVVFVVPGSFGIPDFKGIEYGQFSKKDRAVVVQVAVPPQIVHSETALAFIVQSLHGANAMAFEFFRQKGDEFRLRDAEELVSWVASTA